MKKLPVLCLVSCVLLSACTSGGGDHNGLTACLLEKKVVMFGASWCPHCAEQKKAFGRSAKSLPYFECSKNGQQVPECDARQITSYPTWQFPEDAIAALSAEDITDLFQNELAKVRLTTEELKKGVQEQKPELMTQVNDFIKKTDALVASTKTSHEKLKALTMLNEGPNMTLVELPVYNFGRLSGERPLDKIALYSGCSSAYQGDGQPVQ